MRNRQKALKPLKLDAMHASATQALRHRRHRKGTLRIAVIADIARHRRHRKGETDGG